MNGIAGNDLNLVWWIFLPGESFVLDLFLSWIGKDPELINLFRNVGKGGRSGGIGERGMGE